MYFRSLSWCLLALFSVLFVQCQHPAKTTNSTSSQPQLVTKQDSLAVFAPGFISTGLYERDIAVNPTGTEIIYTLGDHKQQHRALVSVRRTDKYWSAPTLLSFSGQHQDIEPFFTTDGQRLYFASNRPMPGEETGKDYNIWYVDRAGVNTWSEPVALDTLINTEGEEFYPSLSNNGKLYFTATRKDGIGREDIFVTEPQEGGWSVPQALDTAINTQYYEFNAYIDSEERYLLFSSYGRPDGHGGGDLYISTKDAVGNWTSARNLGPSINSEKLDYCPFIDQQNDVFYFSSERVMPIDLPLKNVAQLGTFSNGPQNGMGDIYQVSSSVLNLPVINDK